MTPTRQNSEIGDSVECPAEELRVVTSESPLGSSVPGLPGLGMLEELAGEAGFPKAVPQNQAIDWQGLQQRITAITDFDAAFRTCAAAMTTAFPLVDLRWVSCPADTTRESNDATGNEVLHGRRSGCCAADGR